MTRLACSPAHLADADLAPAVYSAKAMLAEVASLLGNTPAVCRKSYIHPAVMALGSNLAKDAESTTALWGRLESGKRPRRLYTAEGRLLAFLKEHRRVLKAGVRNAAAKNTRRKPAVAAAA